MSNEEFEPNRLSANKAKLVSALSEMIARWERSDRLVSELAAEIADRLFELGSVGFADNDKRSIDLSER